jgi:ribosome assembly protein YihI (activator of Der GTPase)
MLKRREWFGGYETGTPTGRNGGVQGDIVEDSILGSRHKLPLWVFGTWTRHTKSHWPSALYSTIMLKRREWFGGYEIYSADGQWDFVCLVHVPKTHDSILGSRHKLPLWVFGTWTRHTKSHWPSAL